MASELEEVGLGLVMEFRSAGAEAFAAVRESLEAIGGEFTNAEGKAEGFASHLNTLQGAGLVAAAGLAAVAVAAGAVAAAAISMAAPFETSTTQLVTGAGEAEDALEMVRAGLLSLSREVGASAVELSKGMYLIESAGFHGAEGLKVLEASAKGAKVGAADMAVVADAVTSALNAYHRPASDAVAVTNDLVATVAAGKMHMEDLAGSLGKVLPIASVLGVGLGEVSGAIATMTAQGTNAATATTSLRFLMAALAGPTKAAAKELDALGVGMDEIPGISAGVKKALEDIGVSTSAVADTLTHKGLQAALEQVTDAIGKKFPAGSAAYEAALKNAVGGTRGLTAALELTGVGAETFAKNVASVTDAVNNGGDAVKGWNIVQHDFEFQMERAKAVVSSLLIELGLKLLPYVTQAAELFADKLIPAIEGTVAWFEKYRVILEPLAIGFGVVTVALAAFAVGMVAATLATAAFTAVLAVLTSPITLIVVGIALVIAAGVALYQHWDLVKAKAGEAWGWVSDRFTEASTAIGAALIQLGGWFRDRWTDVVSIAQTAAQWVVGAFHAVVDGLRFIYDHNYYVQAFVDLLVGDWNNLVTGTRLAWNLISLIFRTVMDFITTYGPSALQGYIDGAKAMWQSLSDATGAVWGVIKQVIEIAWAGIVFSFKSATDPVIAIFSGLWDGIKAIFNAAGEWFATIGRRMVDGLIGALRASLGPILHFMADLGIGVAASLASALGIHSPSTVFAEIGYNVIAGYVQGVQGAAPQASSATTGALGAPALLGSRPTIPAPAGAAGRGGGVAEIRLIIQGVPTTSELVDKLGNALADKLKLAVRTGVV